MGKKKHKRYLPQMRKREKKTTGRREFVNVVYLEKEKSFDPVHEEYCERIYATCTCGNWRSSDKADTIAKVGHEAKAHVEASEGKCRLRPHAQDVSETDGEAADPLSEQAIT